MAQFPGKTTLEESEITAFTSNDWLRVARDIGPDMKKITTDNLKKDMVANVSLTISSGEVSIIAQAPKIFATIDTEGAIASDDLDKINGGYAGQEIIIQAADSARTIVIKDGANIRCQGGTDFSLDHVNDKWHGIFVSANNIDEISRSNNS
jgi:hypothetical protein